jgi:hypothetical protein
MTTHPHRLSRTQLARTAANLNSREHAILADIANFRLMTSQQIRRLHFASYTSPIVAGRTTSAATRRLTTLGLITHLERRVGGARQGSDSYTWHLTPAGTRLAQNIIPAAQPAQIYKEPSLRTLNHTLANTETYTRLRELAHNQRIDLIAYQPEPASWRRHTNSYGALTTLKPDAFAITAARNSRYEHVWFIEIDLATESKTTIARKADQYNTYYHTGQEQNQTGTFPLVIWITPDQTRADTIKQNITGKTPNLHHPMTLNQFTEIVQRE